LPQIAIDPDAEDCIQHTRALANWEPGYPTEKLDYYDEFIARHAPINVGWLNIPKGRNGNKDDFKEATGVGLLHAASTTHAVAPLDDGSICIFDVSARQTTQNGGGGKLINQSEPGLLTGLPLSAAAETHHMMMTETGAVECVSIDSSCQRGFFAVQQCLHEVDLNTLQICSSKDYPFPITALSEVSKDTPLTVGTNATVHLYDPRDSAFLSSGTSSGGELIGGSMYSHATLEEYGPLSILNHPIDDSIWVAGRFKSLLNYDRRYFPRLRGTIFSGATVACLSSLPHPYIPRNLDLLRNPSVTVSNLQHARSEPGTTLLAAATYKGKGSLELYGLPGKQLYQNRQTASASKLFSVAPHGGRIVFSDGDGNLKWVERDAHSSVRSFNINDAVTKDSSQQTDSSTARGLWGTTGSEAPGQGDIVQKILPFSSPQGVEPRDQGIRPDINQNNLLLWTGDGRLGVLGFGHGNPLGEELWHDAVEEQLTTEQRAREDAERQHSAAMRRALERNADEVRFVRGLGMGYAR
jgi:hypothetical protein